MSGVKDAKYAVLHCLSQLEFKEHLLKYSGAE